MHLMPVHSAAECPYVCFFAVFGTQIGIRHQGSGLRLAKIRHMLCVRGVFCGYRLRVSTRTYVRKFKFELNRYIHSACVHGEKHQRIVPAAT